MKKSIIIACSFLWTYNPTHGTAMKPIKLESEILRTFDGSLINANIMHLLTRYKRQLDTFIYTQYKTSTGTHNLINLVRLEDAHTMPEDARALFPSITKEFIGFSEQFLHALQAVKAGLVGVIEEECTKRNRPDSILLKWSHIENGEERALFDKEITSYRSLCSFCIDVHCFLDDLIHSCPKALKRYEDEMSRFHTIREHMDALLKLDNITLNTQEYKMLLHTINSHHGQSAITKASVKTLYDAHLTTIRR